MNVNQERIRKEMSAQLSEAISKAVAGVLAESIAKILEQGVNAAQEQRDETWAKALKEAGRGEEVADGGSNKDGSAT